jgi:hypothetical protein
MQDGLQVGLVVADVDVAVVGVGERAAVQAAGLQPGEEGPAPGAVGAPGVAVQRVRCRAAAWAAWIVLDVSGTAPSTPLRVSRVLGFAG